MVGDTAVEAHGHESERKTTRLRDRIRPTVPSFGRRDPERLHNSLAKIMPKWLVVWPPTLGERRKKSPDQTKESEQGCHSRCFILNPSGAKDDDQEINV